MKSKNIIFGIGIFLVVALLSVIIILLTKERQEVSANLDFSKIKETVPNLKKDDENIFGLLMEITDSTLLDLYGIDPSLMEEYYGQTSALMVHSSMFLIIKPLDGKEDEVKEQVAEYMLKLEEQWKIYLPSQYSLVINRLETKLGDYLIYIVSVDNDLVLNTIKEAKK